MISVILRECFEGNNEDFPLIIDPTPQSLETEMYDRLGSLEYYERVQSKRGKQVLKPSYI